MDLGRLNLMSGDAELWATCLRIILINLAAGRTSMDSLQPLLTRGLLYMVVDEIHGSLSVTRHRLLITHLVFSSLGTGLSNAYRGALSWYEIQPRSRSKLISGNWKKRGADALRLLVRPSGPISGEDVRKWDEDGTPLICLVLFCLGLDRHPASANASRRETWKELIREVVAAGENMYVGSDRRLFGWIDPEYCGTTSPLIAFLLGAAWQFEYLDSTPLTPHRYVRQLQRTLHDVLKALAECQVDLAAYGRREAEELAANHALSMSPYQAGL